MGDLQELSIERKFNTYQDETFDESKVLGRLSIRDLNGGGFKSSEVACDPTPAAPAPGTPARLCRLLVPLRGRRTAARAGAFPTAPGRTRLASSQAAFRWEASSLGDSSGLCRVECGAKGRL